MSAAGAPTCELNEDSTHARFYISDRVVVVEDHGGRVVGQPAGPHLQPIRGRHLKSLAPESVLVHGDHLSVLQDGLRAWI